MSCNAWANFMNVRSQNGCLYLDGYIDEHTEVIFVVKQHTSWLVTCKYIVHPQYARHICRYVM